MSNVRNTQRSLYGKFEVSPDSETVPTGGLSPNSTYRAEILFDDDTAWISVFSVIGDINLFLGDVGDIELTTLTDEILDRCAADGGRLRICRGNDIIGHFFDYEVGLSRDFAALSR